MKIKKFKIAIKYLIIRPIYNTSKATLLKQAGFESGAYGRRKFLPSKFNFASWKMQ